MDLSKWVMMSNDGERWIDIFSIPAIALEFLDLTLERKSRCANSHEKNSHEKNSHEKNSHEKNSLSFLRSDPSFLALLILLSFLLHQHSSLPLQHEHNNVSQRYRS